MENLPIFSILIINNNTPKEYKFLEQSVESALNQDYPAKGIVIIDNNTNDGSLDRLKEYGGEYVVDNDTEKAEYGTYKLKNNKMIGLIKLKSIQNQDELYKIGIDSTWNQTHIYSFLDSFTHYSNHNILSKVSLSFIYYTTYIGIAFTDYTKYDCQNNIRTHKLNFIHNYPFISKAAINTVGVNLPYVEIVKKMCSSSIIEHIPENFIIENTNWQSKLHDARWQKIKNKHYNEKQP